MYRLNKLITIFLIVGVLGIVLYKENHSTYLFKHHHST